MTSSGGEHVLRCVDSDVLGFVMRANEFGDRSAHIQWVKQEAADLVPWGLNPQSDDSLYAWLESRALPLNRRFADRICQELGIAPNDVSSLYDVSMGLSLNDSYWTPKVEFAGTFAEVNLYENEFSKELGAVAYTGELVNHGPNGSPHGLTPELTTDGTLRKAWFIAPDGTRLLKKGASEGSVPGEPISELIVSGLASMAALNAVPYALLQTDNGSSSVCPCFCTSRVGYFSFANATGIRDMGPMLAFAATCGSAMLDSFCDMLVLDSLVMNTDRHYANFGLLRDMSDGHLIGPSPIFDNGRSLLFRVPDEMLADSAFEVSCQSPSFGGDTFEELASRVIGERQLAWLESLHDTDLMEVLAPMTDPVLLPAVSRRVAGLASILSERLDALRSLKPVSHDVFVDRLLAVWKEREEKRMAPGFENDVRLAKPGSAASLDFSPLVDMARVESFIAEQDKGTSKPQAHDITEI